VVTWYSREHAAGRAGVEPGYLGRLVDLGILAPEEPDRFSPGDVRRVLMARSLEDAGIPLDGVAGAIERGTLSLDFLDSAAYERFPALGGETFRQVSDRTGIPIKWLGDGVMFHFRDPSPGIRAALEMVDGVQAAGLPPAHVGLHTGPVLFQQGDYFGQTVNLTTHRRLRATRRGAGHPGGGRRLARDGDLVPGHRSGGAQGRGRAGAPAAGPPHLTGHGLSVREDMAGRVVYRPATDADVEAEHAVFVAAEGELLARHGFGWTTPPAVVAAAPTLRHFQRHDGERCFVAEVDGRVVGYSAAWVREATWFLGGLFVDPGHQGRGIGRRLLELALAGAPARRTTISDAIQPVSNALYAGYGLLPTTPILTFTGTPTVDAPSDLVASEPTADTLALLDRDAYGFDRAVDHAFWAAEATPTLWLRNGEPVAYSYRWPRGRIGPLGGRDEASAAAALQAELARQPGPRVEIPGTCRSLVRVALAAGLRLASPPGLLLLSDAVEPPRSLATASYGLL
jgi:GNAT superfamily N-acetyltransferase